MKTQRTNRERWRDELRQELVHDPYQSKGKPPEATRCPECGAVYHGGRWQWGAAGAGAHEQLCPACHRMRDHFPAGYVTLSGPFVSEHRDELLQLARHHEAKEKAEHPLERIMAIEDVEGGVLITTTDTHLAHDIGEAVRAAYSGSLEFRYSKEENLLRVHWTR